MKISEVCEISQHEKNWTFFLKVVVWLVQQNLLEYILAKV